MAGVREEQTYPSSSRLVGNWTSLALVGLILRRNIVSIALVKVLEVGVEVGVEVEVECPFTLRVEKGRLRHPILVLPTPREPRTT